MTDKFPYQLRPLGRFESALPEAAFRAWTTRKDLDALGLKSGDICHLSSAEGLSGLAIAWESKDTSVNKPRVKVSGILRDACGFTYEGGIAIKRADGCFLIHADLVSIVDVTDDTATKSEKIDSGRRCLSIASLWQYQTIAVKMVYEISFKGQKRRFRIQAIEPAAGHSNASALYAFDDHSKLQFQEAPVEGEAQESLRAPLMISSEGIGGLRKQIQQINKRLTRLNGEINGRKVLANLRRSGGILLYGPEGTGKSLLLSKLKEAPWRKVLTIDDSTLDRTTRQNKSTITEVFAEAVAHEPSIIVIDKLEAIAGTSDRDSSLGDSLASVLAMELDKLKHKQVLVVGTTSKPNDVDKRLRTPGRFRYEIEVPIPDLHARIAILEVLGDACVSTYDYPMEKIGERTHGFVGADLEALYEAALDSAIDRQYEKEEKVGVHPRKENGVLDSSSHPLLGPEGFNKERTIADVDGKAVIEILQEDWEKALLEVRPTAMKEVFIETPKVRWTDIGGSADVKEALTQVIEWPLKYPEKLAELELESSKGILLYGPPGCSKTLTAKAIATEAGLNFIAVKGAEFIQSYVGESERALRGIFDKARQASPSVIFFDEIDAIGASSRGHQSGLNIVTTLLNEMDGIGGLQGVLVLAATNKPEILDPALLRPGRFDELMYIGPPNLEARIEIINLRTRSKPLDPDVNVAALALRTDGYSGAELVSVCMEATKSYMKRWVELETLGEQMSTTEARVTQQDFDHALEKVVSRITPEMTRRYELWSQGASG